MIGLIKKNFYAERIYTIFFIICSLLYVGMYLFIKEVIFESIIKDDEYGRTILSLIPVIIVSEFNCKLFKNEFEMPATEKYFNILPVSRFQITLSKFISSIAFSFLGLLMSYFSLYCFTISDNANFYIKSFQKIFIAFLFIVFFIAFQLPILIYNGNEVVSLLVPTTCIITPITIYCVIKKLYINEFITNLLKWISKHDLGYSDIILVLSGILCIVLVISFLISYKIYKRREF